jgi:putative hydrolase of the HAD superfamily
MHPEEEAAALCRLPAGGLQTARPLPGDAVAGRLRTARRSAIVRSRSPERSQRIAAVLLDIGGVVIPTLFESVALPGFPRGPLGREADYAAVERGDTNERDYWAELARRHPELDIGTLWRACSHVRGEVRDAVRVMTTRVKVVAFTNDMAHWFGESWRDRFADIAAFHAVIESVHLGVAKPDPEAFRRAASEIGELPQRCLFVDDLEVNVAGALAAGMQTLLFDVRAPGEGIAALLARLGLDAGLDDDHRTFRLPR